MHKDLYPTVDIGGNVNAIPLDNTELNFSYIFASTEPNIAFPAGSIIEFSEIASEYDMDYRRGNAGKEIYSCYITVRVPEKYTDTFKQILRELCIEECYEEYIITEHDHVKFGLKTEYVVGDYCRYAFNNPFLDGYYSSIKYCEIGKDAYAYVEIVFKDSDRVKPLELNNSKDVRQLSQITPPDMGAISYIKTRAQQNSIMPYSYYIELWIPSEILEEYNSYIRNEDIAIDIIDTEKAYAVIEENEQLKKTIQDYGLYSAYEYTYDVDDAKEEGKVLSYVFITKSVGSLAYVCVVVS